MTLSLTKKEVQLLLVVSNPVWWGNVNIDKNDQDLWRIRQKLQKLAAPPKVSNVGGDIVVK